MTRWCKKFKQGRDSIEDVLRSGKPINNVTDNSIHTVEKLIMNRKIKIAEIVFKFNMSTGSVESIIHSYLGHGWIKSNVGH